MAGNSNPSEINKLFDAQQMRFRQMQNSGIRERKKKLKLLEKVVYQHREDIRQALLDDYGKSATEVDLSEIFPVLKEIRFARSRLRKWSSRARVNTPLFLAGNSSFILPEPKGICLVISPWNFPVNLTLIPVVSAIAAGNTVIIKPSEFTTNTSKLLHKMISDNFPSSEVAVVRGDKEIAKELLSYPFDHIFFTGSPSVGKKVMSAASENLSSVTLELGGKSPLLVDESADIKSAAKKSAWVKFFNAGQICIAPDYALVHKSKVIQFVNEFKKATKALYSDSGAGYTNIINDTHYKRLKDYLKDVDHEQIFELDSEGLSLAPTLVTNVKSGPLLEEEIFGPILPVIQYDSMDEAISFIHQRQKPLAFYIFSTKKRNIRRLLKEVRCGGITINDCALHFYNPNLPFGGVNNSGIGKSHGYYGFLEFSNLKSVVKKSRWGNSSGLLMPPYNRIKKLLIKFSMRWL